MRFKSTVILPLIAITGSHFGVYAQTISAGGVVNTASAQSPVAPGSMISIVGTNLASTTVGASSTPLPTTLGGVSALVNGMLAPLFLVSPTQINAQLPYEISPGSATLVVTVNGSSSAPMSFLVATAAPGIMMYGANRAVALNQDATLNGSDHPALVGSGITVFLTGQGPVDSPVASGAASPEDPLAGASLPVTASIGGQPADLLFAGLAPGGVGLFQVSVRIPALASGDFPLIVTIGGAPSNPVLIAVLAPGANLPTSSIVRTMVYHQLTSLPDTGPDGRSSTVLSGNGAVIAYTYAPASTRADNPNRIYVMNFDGTGSRQVDSYQTQCFCGSIVDISDDGSKVASTEGRQVRISDDKGARALVTVDTGVSGIRIQGDGLRVFFLLDRDGHFAGSSGTGPVQRGLYVINSDGSGLRQIVGPNQVGALFGTKVTDSISPQFAITGNAPNHTLGVTRDGARIAFGAQKFAGNGPDAIFGVNLDGSGLHFVAGPTAYVYHLNISADGSKVLSDTLVEGWVESAVANFDGTARRAFRRDGIGNAPGIQLSADGSLLLALDTLYNTDGSGALQLSATFNALTPGSPVMNAAATRFVYSFVYPGTYSQGLTQLASAEINPVSLGAAPPIVGPAVNPDFVMPDGNPEAVVTAGVSASNKVIGVSYAIVREGLVEQPHDADVFLVDDGTNGDKTAGDGIFTSGNVHAPYDSLSGPRTLRLFAQVLDPAQRRHATLVDVAPFFVVSQPPAGPPPRTDAIAPSSGSAGSQATVTGSGFDSTPSNNQVILGSRLAHVLSASSTQLVIVIPPGLPVGPASLVVATQGQTSNTSAFTVR
jgi:uncharacterized protein (TIGR03437 family)